MDTENSNELEGAENSATPEQADTQESAPEETPQAQASEPAPLAPALPPANDEVAQLRAQLAEQRELMAQYMRGQQAPASVPPPEPELDIEKFVSDHFQGESAAAMAKVLKHMEQRIERRYARREELMQTAAQAQQVAVSYQEQQAQNSLRSRGVPDADIQEVARRVNERANKHRGQQLWTSADNAYKETLADLLLERQYAQADKAAAARAAVQARQQKAVVPVSNAAPTGNGKVKIDVREIRKQAGRKLSTAELLDAMEKAGA